MNEKVSFIVINRNNEQYINKCMTALFELIKHYKHAEIILVDDNSTDHSLGVLEKQPHVLIHHEQNLGIATARNSGLKAAHGEYVFIIDSDIEVTKLDLLKITTLFRENPLLVGLSGRYYSNGKSNRNRVLDLRREEIYFKKHKTFVYTLASNYTTLSGGMCVFAKDRLPKVEQSGKLFISGEDIRFQVELLSQGYQMAYSDALSGIHHHHRTFKGTMRKMVSEGGGDVWVTSGLISENISLPRFTDLFNFPLLLIIALATRQWIILLYSFSPYLFLIAKRRDLLSIQLLLYQFGHEVAVVYFAVRFAFSRVRLVDKLKYCYFGSVGDILFPIRWFKRI